MCLFFHSYSIYKLDKTTLKQMLSSQRDIHIYINIYIYILKSVYLGSKLLFKQVLSKKMEHYLLFLILFFQVSLLFFLCWDLSGKRIRNDKNSNYQLKTILPLMTTKSMVKSAWAGNMGQFLYHLDSNTRKLTRRLVKMKLKIINSVPLSLL